MVALKVFLNHKNVEALKGGGGFADVSGQPGLVVLSMVWLRDWSASSARLLMVLNQRFHSVPEGKRGLAEGSG